MTYRLGIDIGGTFTDATLIDEESGKIHIGKTPSTPQDLSLGFMEATRRILRENAVSPAEVTTIVHGTTVATNAIIEGKVTRTALVTTDGFRDILEIANQIRPSLFDLQFEQPKPLVPRYLCFGVPERMDARGQVLTPLDETAVRSIALRLQREQVESIAVCLLHSYANPAHEQRVGEIFREVSPAAVVSLSSEVVPEFREYSRASTTVINAGIRPVVARYLDRIQDRLRDEQLEAKSLLMQSSGGVFTFAEASRNPVFMVESGPAAGVISTAHLGATIGRKDVISFDMGGTTAKVGLVQDGSPRVTKDYEVGPTARVGTGSQRGGGYPIRTPVIDLVEIGAGGGSIAWVDSGDVLRVGPQSAGADPGPVCYGQGGTQPTITDANLVLGRLQGDFFLGGAMTLDAEAAHRAIQKECAAPLGLDVVAAAHGIVEIANAAMVNALRLVSVQRGYDPRDFTLVAFGGAGPVHANRLAAETEMPTLIVPRSPGTFSSLGLLVTDLKHDFSTTRIQRTDRLDLAALENAFGQLEARAVAALDRDGVLTSDRRLSRHVDMRYVGQSYELTIALPARQLEPEDIDRLLDHFYEEHDRAYGYSASGEPVELVNLRLSAVGKIAKPRLQEFDEADFQLPPAQKAVRSVYFAETGGFVDCPIYDRCQLGPGLQFNGPSMVVELDSTTVIHPGYAAEVDPFGNLVVTPGNRAC